MTQLNFPNKLRTPDSAAAANALATPSSPQPMTLDEQLADMLADEDEDYSPRPIAAETDASEEAPTSERRRNLAKRVRITQKHRDVLDTLNLCQYATVNQLIALHEGETGTRRGETRRKSGQPVSVSVMKKRLKALESLGLVERYFFGRELWFSTHTGAAIVEASREPYRASNFSPVEISHVLALAQVVASFKGGLEEGVRFATRHDVLGEGRALGGEFVSEAALKAAVEAAKDQARRQLTAAAKPGQEVKPAAVQQRLALSATDAVRKTSVERLPRLLTLHPELWCPTTVWEVEHFGKKYSKDLTRRPDLVIARSASAAGEPQSVAVEIELSGKESPEKLERFMEAYGNWRKVYGRVVWIYKDERVKEKLLKAIKSSGTSDLITVRPLLDSHGKPFTGNVLMDL